VYIVNIIMKYDDTRYYYTIASTIILYARARVFVCYGYVKTFSSFIYTTRTEKAFIFVVRLVHVSKKVFVIYIYIYL